MALRVLELFCGIGGCATALGERGEVVAAIDVNRNALDVYARNFSSGHAATVESIPESLWRDWRAELWWLSPPCQPFTRRGHQRDAEDPRAAPFLAVIQRIAQLQPPHVAVENVTGFAGSRVQRRLLDTLQSCGYQIREQILCPSQLGIPNRRPRYYLVASRQELLPAAIPRASPRKFAVGDILEQHVSDELSVRPEDVSAYRQAMHLVDADDEEAITACFTSAYGRSHIRSGSYLATCGGVRRFSPREILRLLCFPETFQLPPALPPQRAWPLVGNSLSIVAVRCVLAAIPGCESLHVPTT
jgi:site-specific DNA-cytosine methylase